jgi:hypothetical protein
MIRQVSTAGSASVGATSELPARVPREVDAITRYLQREWDVSVTKGSVRELVAYVVAQGVGLGDRFGKDWLREQQQTANTTIESANHARGTKQPTFNFPLDAEPPADFGAEATRLEAQVQARFGVTARPKAVVPDDAYPTSDAAPFDGAPLHRTLAVASPGFAESLSPEGVRYNLDRDRSELNTLVSAIARQGMTVAVLDLDERYGTKIRAGRDQARAALSPSST